VVTVVQEAYVNGVSTRRVDDLVKALGINGLSKSQVSRLGQALDTEVERFRTRKLDGSFASIQKDATFVKVRQDHRVVSMAVVIAVGVNQDGQDEMLGQDVGPSEDGAFWHAFLRSLVARGVTGVKLVTSDAHEGLKAALASVLQGASWQRCRTHLMRNALAPGPRAAQRMVSATIRTVFYPADAESARSTWRRVADGFRPRWLRLAKTPRRSRR
jgi:putative transposase